MTESGGANRNKTSVLGPSDPQQGEPITQVQVAPFT